MKDFGSNIIQCEYLFNLNLYAFNMIIPYT